jgi:hypothetical protein
LEVRQDTEREEFVDGEARRVNGMDIKLKGYLPFHDKEMSRHNSVFILPMSSWRDALNLMFITVVRFEVSKAVTMKNVVFWDIKTQVVPHRRHITSPLQSPAG